MRHAFELSAWTFDVDHDSCVVTSSTMLTIGFCTLLGIQFAYEISYAVSCEQPGVIERTAWIYYDVLDAFFLRD